MNTHLSFLKLTSLHPSLFIIGQALSCYHPSISIYSQTYWKILQSKTSALRGLVMQAQNHSLHLVPPGPPLPYLGPKAFAACLFALQDCSRCEANISKHDSSDHLHLQIFRKGSLQALAFTFMYFPLSSSGAEACGITPKSCWTMDPQEGDHVPHKPCTHALTATFR